MLHLIFSTFSDEETAARIGKQLIEEKFAACLNIVPKIRSIYLWEGQIEDQSEVLGIFKVPEEKTPAFIEKLNVLHPYDVPEIVAISSDKVLPAYGEWVVQSTDV